MACFADAAANVRCGGAVITSPDFRLLLFYSFVALAADSPLLDYVEWCVVR